MVAIWGGGMDERDGKFKGKEKWRVLIVAF